MQLAFDQFYWKTKEPLSSAGSLRTLVGEMAEVVAANALNAQRLTTSGRQWYCPDLVNERGYYEVKACGFSKQIIIYSVRLEKDRAFAEDHTLTYAVLSHEVEFPVTDVDRAWRRINYGRLFLFPFRYVEGVCASLAPRILNHNYKPANGWCQRGYEKGGYTVPLKLLIQSFPYGYLPTFRLQYDNQG